MVAAQLYMEMNVAAAAADTPVAVVAVKAARMVMAAVAARTIVVIINPIHPAYKPAMDWL